MDGGANPQSRNERLAREEMTAKNSKRYVTVDRGAGLYELTVIGITGQTHLYDTDNKGRDGHFTDEGSYRRAIEKWVEQNTTPPATLGKSRI